MPAVVPLGVTLIVELPSPCWAESWEPQAPPAKESLQKLECCFVLTPPLKIRVRCSKTMPGYAGRNEPQHPSARAACDRADVAARDKHDRPWCSCAHGNHADFSGCVSRPDRCVSYAKSPPGGCGAATLGTVPQFVNGGRRSGRKLSVPTLPRQHAAAPALLPPLLSEITNR